MSLNIQKIVEELEAAEGNRKPVLPLSERYGLTVDTAYQIQQAWAAKQIEKGRELVGYKIGLTSKAAQDHFNVFEPDFGHLFSDMRVADGGVIPLNALIQPKIEGEVAFVLGADLMGPVNEAQAIQAVAGVYSSMEIVDSRIQDWKIGAADTISDNGSSARFVIGNQMIPLKGICLPEVGMALSQNDEVEVTGAGAAVMEDPIHALVFLANILSKFGVGLKKGQIVLSGSLGGMIPLKSGALYRCEMMGLGVSSVRVSEGESK